ncbi:MAG: DnaJ domain-containing protein [Thermodesulfobacteriota bacterium]
MPMHSQARSDSGRTRFASSSTTDWAALEQQLSRTKTILQEILDHLQGVLRNLRAARAGQKNWARGATRTEKPGFRSGRPGTAGFGHRAQEAKGTRQRPCYARFERTASGPAGGASASGRPFEFRREQSSCGGQSGAADPSGQSGQKRRSTIFGQAREGAGQKTATGSPYRTSFGNRAAGGNETSAPGGTSAHSGPFASPGRAQAGASSKNTQTGQAGAQGRSSFGQTSRPGQTRAFQGSNAYETRRETVRPEAGRHRYSGERQERGRQNARASGMNLKCAYDILCLDYPCTAGEIKDAYRGMARLFHPDLGGDEEVMKDINLAYELAMRFCAGPRRSGTSWTA